MITGNTKSPHEAIYGAYMDRQRAIAKGGWKVILYPKIPKAIRYDLANEPTVKMDLAEDPAFAPKIAKLRSALGKLPKENGSPL